jgi:N-glycosylase/DNA lyase
LNRFSVTFPQEEFDLTLCISSGQIFRWEAVSESEWVGVDGADWFQVVRSRGGTYEIESSGSEEQFRSLFALDTNLGEIKQRIVAQGPEMAAYVNVIPGLRLLRPTSPHEVLFCFLCTANNHLSRITQMVRKLASYGTVIHEVAGRALYEFPRLEVIAGIPEAELRAGGFGYRAATIPRVAAEILGKDPDWLTLLAEQSYQEAHAELITLPSVGPKLADCFALYGLHQSNSVPIDTHLWQALVRLYFPEWEGKAVTDMRYRIAGEFMRERFGDDAGIAHLFLYYENLLNWRKR